MYMVIRKVKNKNIYTIFWGVSLCVLISFILFVIPISRETKKHEDIYIKHINNGYEVKIKPFNDIVKIGYDDIEIQYVSGYVSKNGRKAHLEEYTIKTITGYRKNYKLIITETID